ncbi:peroxiredoxin [Pleionea mediterranea]|uniref:thioredoxin-dependent peroxiredoxin n=1 Tax=Pleionea mediterranea TaxID=523701 RepID=A0A316FK57_9GAMM|nr:peroxiredoxin [Pleionea mediterranea]PWK49321.1 peroxiredoxin Q/BCP [Pleionea mediterranea]
MKLINRMTLLFFMVTMAAIMTPSVVEAKDWTGALFPEFELKNQAGEVISDNKYEGKWVAYYFYPKDNTPGCSIEAENFAKNHKKFQELGLEIVGISLDDVESHKSFAKTYNVEFDLLADVDKSLSKKLDMVNYLPWPHTRRETFIVDGSGNIVKHYQEVNPKSHVEQIFADLKTLKKQLK